MRMDIDYAIEIMEALAEHPNPEPGATGSFPPESICPEIEDEIERWNNPQWQRYNEHCRLLGEAGYVEIDENRPEFRPQRLTYSGQDYVRTIQTPGAREHVKSVARKAGDLTLAVVLELAKKYAWQQLGV